MKIISLAIPKYKTAKIFVKSCLPLQTDLMLGQREQRRAPCGIQLHPHLVFTLRDTARGRAVKKTQKDSNKIQKSCLEDEAS